MTYDKYFVISFFKIKLFSSSLSWCCLSPRVSVCVGSVRCVGSVLTCVPAYVLACLNTYLPAYLSTLLQAFLTNYQLTCVHAYLPDYCLTYLST